MLNLHDFTYSEIFTATLDISVCTLVLRIVLGWLVNYPRLLRLVIVLASLSAFGALVEYFKLPVASLYLPYIIIPVILVTLLNYLPDLTRIYKAASRGVILNSQIPTNTRLIPELAKTLHHMTEKRIGAIIAVARKDSIDACVSGGEAVNAKINRSLLLSIFDTHCPRHDGAALIEGDYIVKIGAVLPLASAELTDPKLGTRHLAALGLTQHCDADVFVVSEERGSLCHVQNGQIKDISVSSAESVEDKLLQILKDEAAQTDRSQPRQWGSLLWALALTVSVVASSGITLIRHENQSEQTQSVVSVEGKIKLINLAEHLTAEEIEPSTVTVLFTLHKDIELAENYTIVVDVADWDEGKRDVRLVSEMIEKLNPNISISRFEPEEVEIRLVEE